MRLLELRRRTFHFQREDKHVGNQSDGEHVNHVAEIVQFIRFIVQHACELDEGVVENANENRVEQDGHVLRLGSVDLREPMFRECCDILFVVFRFDHADNAFVAELFKACLRDFNGLRVL